MIVLLINSGNTNTSYSSN